MSEYEITIAGAYDLLILTPEMIALLIERTQKTAKRELHIPADELLPPGYAAYLIRVLEANAEILPEDARELRLNSFDSLSRNVSILEVYQLAARQLKQLRIREQACLMQ